MNGSSRLRTVVGTAGFLLIAAFFLSTEHRAHLFGVLPFLLILACPLLHVFMHGGHGEHPPRDRSGPAPRGTGAGDPHAGHGATSEDVR